MVSYADWEDDMGDQRHELGRKFFEHQDRQAGPLGAELVTADYQAHLGGNPPMDRAGHDAFGKAFYAGFPDLRHEVTDVFAEGDKVAVRFMLQGTHTGTLFGMIPPTGKRVTVWANVLMHLEGGKVKRLYGTFDEAGMLRQLGVIPG